MWSVIRLSLWAVSAQGIHQHNESWKLKFIPAQLPGKALEVYSALTSKTLSNDCSSKIYGDDRFALIERAKGRDDWMIIVRNISGVIFGWGNVVQRQIHAVQSRDRQAWQVSRMESKQDWTLQRIRQTWAYWGRQEGVQWKGLLGAQNFTGALWVYKVNPAGSVIALGMREMWGTLLRACDSSKHCFGCLP